MGEWRVRSGNVDRQDRRLHPAVDGQLHGSVLIAGFAYLLALAANPASGTKLDPASIH